MRNTLALVTLTGGLAWAAHPASLRAQPIAPPALDPLPSEVPPPEPAPHPSRPPSRPAAVSTDSTTAPTVSAAAPASPRPSSSSVTPGASSSPAEAEGEGEATVRGERSLSAASDARVRQRDLELRPRTRPADLFEVAPGMLVVQHAGGGKANQYFLRGFDADHGTDVALSVDGVPFNNVSHGHGQGYADPHFIIPELVERVDVHEGPYHASDGDFATAGAINLRYLTRVRQHSLSLEGGMYGHGRLLGIVRTDAGRLSGYLATELATDDGAFVNPMNYRRVNAVGRWSYQLADRACLTLTVMTYAGAWNASGQVPSRLADDPASGFDRFGSVDPTEGGQSDRHSISLALHAPLGDRASVDAVVYAVRYRLGIFSNFTFFADDPERGDMIEQTDDRTIAGFRAAWQRAQTVGAWRFETAVGVQSRADFIDNGLYHDQARRRLDTRALANIRETAVGLFAEEQVTPARWLRVVLGVRADLFGFTVEDRRTGLASPDPEASGIRQALIASPKASVVLSPWRWLDLYINFGSGFHSNDARGVVRATAPVTPLARALGAEVGARVRLANRFDLALSAWGVDLESEIVWVGDDGTTDARGPTRRLGVTGELRGAITPWLRADADVSFVRATYTSNAGNGDAVALAPQVVLSAGLAGRHPSGIFGALRLRAVGDRPATSDRSLTAEGFAILSAQLGFRRGWWEVALQAENLTNSRWREAQFATDTRLRDECLTATAPRCNEPAAGQRYGTITDVNFTPGTPFAAQLRLTFYVE